MSDHLEELGLARDDDIKMGIRRVSYEYVITNEFPGNRNISLLV
jgi:hypothetical protein